MTSGKRLQSQQSNGPIYEASALTTTDPPLITADEVFTITLNPDAGTYTYDMLQPISKFAGKPVKISCNSALGFSAEQARSLRKELEKIAATAPLCAEESSQRSLSRTRPSVVRPLKYDVVFSSVNGRHELLQTTHPTPKALTCSQSGALSVRGRREVFLCQARWPKTIRNAMSPR